MLIKSSSEPELTSQCPNDNDVGEEEYYSTSSEEEILTPLDREIDLKCNAYDWARNLVNRFTGTKPPREPEEEPIPELFYYRKPAPPSSKPARARPGSSSSSGIPARARTRATSPEKPRSASEAAVGTGASRAGAPRSASVRTGTPRSDSAGARAGAPRFGGLRTGAPRSAGPHTGVPRTGSVRSGPRRPVSSRGTQAPAAAPSVHIVRSEESLAAAETAARAADALHRAQRLFGPLRDPEP